MEFHQWKLQLRIFKNKGTQHRVCYHLPIPQHGNKKTPKNWYATMTIQQVTNRSQMLILLGSIGTQK